MTRKPRTDQRARRIMEVLAKRQNDLTLVINNIHDPHNVSAILRSCDAFGIPRVHLLYTSNVFPELGKKSSASAKKWVERMSHSRPSELLRVLRQQGLIPVRTGFSPRAVPVHEWDFTGPTAVILGNEHSGVEKDLLEEVEHELYIPMQGMIQSLNVSVAAAIILYEAFRQRNEAGLYSRPSFLPQELEAYFDKWIQK
jgi:tRNA (guanosine-2'-O-)-methyltransferase